MMNAPKKYVRPTIKCPPGRTKQSFREEADINNIIARYTKTGVLDNLNKNPGRYADVSDLVTYPEALNVVIKSQNLFNDLPANIRERFQNEPAKLIAFLDDEKNLAESVSLGLRKKPKEPPRTEPLPVTAPAAPVTPPATPPAT